MRSQSKRANPFQRFLGIPGATSLFLWLPFCGLKMETKDQRKGKEMWLIGAG
jgi:hypothetical protein